MTTDEQVTMICASIPACQRHVRAATRRKAEVVLRERDRREAELLDALEAAEFRLRRLAPRP